MRLHPLETAERIRQDYIRYLSTIYFFRNEELRRQFRQALSAPDFLTRGPILEAAAPFGPGGRSDNWSRTASCMQGFALSVRMRCR